MKCYALLCLDGTFKEQYLIPQLAMSLWKSAVAITSSATGGDGPVGGQAMRKARNLLHSSVLYIDDERFGRSMKLQKRRIIRRKSKTDFASYGMVFILSNGYLKY